MRVKAQQDQLSKMMNSKPKMTAAQMERSKAKMASSGAGTRPASRGGSMGGRGQGAQIVEKGNVKSINDSLINKSNHLASTNDEEQFSGDNSRRMME